MSRLRLRSKQRLLVVRFSPPSSPSAAAWTAGRRSAAPAGVSAERSPSHPSAGQETRRRDSAPRADFPPSATSAAGRRPAISRSDPRAAPPRPAPPHPPACGDYPATTGPPGSRSPDRWRPSTLATAARPGRGQPGQPTDRFALRCRSPAPAPQPPGRFALSARAVRVAVAE